MLRDCGKGATIEVAFHGSTYKYDVTEWDYDSPNKVLQFRTTDEELVTFPSYSIRYFSIKKKK